MSLVGDDHDIPAAAEERKFVALLLGEELLNGGEDDATRCDLELLTEVGAALHLNWFLAQKRVAPAERTEELVIEVIPVGQDDQRRVLHFRGKDDLPCVKNHRQRLPTALRVPDDADAPVPRGA